MQDTLSSPILAGQTAVVTGGASGIGKSIVQRFLEAGANCLAADLNEEALAALKEEFAAYGDKLDIARVDVSDRDAVEGMVDRAVDMFGQMDIIVNNAGIMDNLLPIAEMDDDVWAVSYTHLDVYKRQLHLRKALPERRGVVEGDAAPQLRRAGGDAGGVLEAAGRQAHERLLVVGVAAGQLHERRGHDVRHMAHHGHRLVVVLARQGDHAGAERRDQLVQAREVLGRRGRVGAEYPVRALEQVGAGTVDAVFLGTGHGVARHVVLGMRQRARGNCRDARLRGGGVRDDAAEIPGRQTLEAVSYTHLDVYKRQSLSSTQLSPHALTPDLLSAGIRSLVLFGRR